MIRDYRPKPDWFERHAGLGGWVGTFGTVIAIFAAWWLARAEYQRSQRLEDARMNAEINLIGQTAREFDPIVQMYIQLWHEGGLGTEDYYKKQLTDGRWLRMVDFNTMPITQWPSVESYDAFKRYFFASQGVMKPLTVGGPAAEVDAFIKHHTEEQINAYKGTLANLENALKAARR